MHELLFSQIKNFIPLKNGQGEIAFILTVKGPQSIPFTTYALQYRKSGEQRHQPTLENIKDLKKVTKLIRQGIQQNN